MTERQPTPLVEVATDGRFSGIDEYARAKVTPLLRLAHEPVLSARVRLTRHVDPAVRRPVVARADLDVNGRPVCVRVTAPTPCEGVDLLVATLRTRLERGARHWEARRGAQAGVATREARHGRAAG